MCIRDRTNPLQKPDFPSQGPIWRQILSRNQISRPPGPKISPQGPIWRQILSKNQISRLRPKNLPPGPNLETNPLQKPDFPSQGPIWRQILSRGQISRPKDQSGDNSPPWKIIKNNKPNSKLKFDCSVEDSQQLQIYLVAGISRTKKRTK